jgi:hypothetical protein
VAPLKKKLRDVGTRKHIFISEKVDEWAFRGGQAAYSITMKASFSSCTTIAGFRNKTHDGRIKCPICGWVQFKKKYILEADSAFSPEVTNTIWGYHYMWYMVSYAERKISYKYFVPPDVLVHNFAGFLTV